jgi:uncharacterized protein
VNGLRALGPGFDPTVVAAVDEKLRRVAERESAVVLLAVESGSRAWGFPSPDSDYDCRFIYARARDDYLSLHAPRDVIEFPIEGILDVNGWDLAKALRLLLKGNAVVIEWLRGPAETTATVFSDAGGPCSSIQDGTRRRGCRERRFRRR